jgi:hypothetical protein
MQFKVPQFLEIEDKIFGPFTFRQFIYLAGGAGLCFVLYRLFGLVLGAVPILIIAGFAGALTFYRPNNKPFVYALEAGFKYFTQSKLYIWKTSDNIRDRGPDSPNPREGYSPLYKTGAENIKLSESKLKDLAWSLDVLDLSKKKEN